MNTPLVSVIVICYNHEKFVKQAVQSIIDQDYPNVEIIISDDASEDQSVKNIKKICADHPDILFIKNDHNIGNCKTFNAAFNKSNGEYIIDLSADDMLEPTRISQGVEMLESHGKSFGMHYSDAWLVDENNTLLGEHSKSTKVISKNPFPSGNLYAKLLERYFICPPSLIARRKVFEKLKGYDEDLSYEDFDFLVRSSRTFLFCVSEKPLVVKRILESSKSAIQSSAPAYYKSTLKVCQKALKMLQSREEEQALTKRILFESRQALRRKQYDVVDEFLTMLTSLNVAKWKLLLYRIIIKFH